MTPQDFERYADRSRLRARGREAARAVLVDGHRQADVAREFGVTRQMVSLWCRSVLRQRRGVAKPPAHWQSVTVTVPPSLAKEIRKLARSALEELRPKVAKVPGRGPGRPRKEPQERPQEAPSVAAAADVARGLLRLIPGGLGRRGEGD